MFIGLAAIFTAIFLAIEKVNAHADAGPGDSGQEVVEVQYILRSYGYVLPVDGEYGPRTTRAVRHFQRANDLLPDGIAGPITMDALKEAIRVDPPKIPPETSSGLRGMPFAPEGYSGCDEMNFYRVQAGLPSQFSDQPRSGPRSNWGYGWRESNCRNDVANACCHGYWQAHEGNWSGTSYAAFFRSHCDAQSASDVFGNSALNKQRQACVTKVMYDISGLQPWRL